MKAVRLHGPKDLRVEELPEPRAPNALEAIIEVGAVGICGSDMHMYGTGAIGGETVDSPMVMGHEFMGKIIRLGDAAFDGNGNELAVGQRVAVEPACPCEKCECCLEGNPNLCPNHRFYGVYPTDGALCQSMVVKSRNCFPIPDEISNAAGALLETLGVAIHAVDLGKLRVARSVAVLGCGPVGLLIVKLAKLAGANPIFAFDKYDWRLDMANRWGADTVVNVDKVNPVNQLLGATSGRGVDVCFEAAWADQSIQQAAEMTRYGGRLVLVGIPPDDRLTMQHATARRKGLTIMMARRMKFTYPRAVQLAGGDSPLVCLDELVSESFCLDDSAKAFAKNYNYEEGVQKIVVNI